MAEEDLNKRLQRSISRHIRFGYLLIFGMFGGMILWAGQTEISGAVIAGGSFVVESSAKEIQHPDGGVIREIHVKESQWVEKGQLLVRLDNSLIQANMELIDIKLVELAAEEARLRAEMDDLEQIAFPMELQLKSRIQKSKLIVRRVMSEQSKLLLARQASRRVRKQQLNEQIEQFHRQISGAQSQLDARIREGDLLTERLAKLEQLYDKKLIPIREVLDMRLATSRNDGVRGALQSEIGRLRQNISERLVQIAQITEETRAGNLERLQEIRAETVSLKVDRVNAEDLLNRIDLKAPVSGVVHELDVHTLGGVISPAETVMKIIPTRDKLVMDLKVSPVDIDQIYPTQDISVQLLSFNMRETPRLNAGIEKISPDLVEEEGTGEPYYFVRARLNNGQIDMLNDEEIVPGMPVVGFIQTGDRTVLSYLIDPILDQLQYAMKEE